MSWEAHQRLSFEYAAPSVRELIGELTELAGRADDAHAAAVFELTEPALREAVATSTRRRGRDVFASQPPVSPPCATPLPRSTSMNSNLNSSRELATEVAAGRIGRATAARLLATSRSAIARLERRGVLHATVDAQGRRWFSAIEISQVAAARRAHVTADPDEIAARAFELFDQHTPLHEVVTELRICPERVRRLRHDWQGMQRVDSLILGRAHVTQIARVIGTVRSPDELAARVSALAGKIDEVEARASDAEFLVDSIIDELGGDGEVKASDLVQRVRELVARASTAAAEP